jgi:predicted amidophosphoribosyltransferase
MYSRAYRIRHWWKMALDWVYPGAPMVCVLCHRIIPEMSQKTTQKFSYRKLITPSTRADAPDLLGQFICPFCLQEARGLKVMPVRRQLRLSKSVGLGPADVDVTVYSPFRYEGFVQRCIRPWKYDGALGLTKWFGNSLATTIETCQLGQAFDFITPVPTSMERLKERGYHHTLLLAHQIGKRCSIRVIQTLVRSHMETGQETQTAKSARQRQEALRGAFRINPRLVAVDGQMPNFQEANENFRSKKWSEVKLRGARVLLLDDVVTTGATLQACTAALLEAGVASVVCLVIADVE